MKWIIAGLYAITCVVTSLRYLVCAQKNNYVFVFGKKTFLYWLVIAALSLPTVVLAVFDDGGYLYETAKIVWSCLVAAVAYVYTVSFKTKLKFTERATKNYVVCVAFSVLFSTIPTAFLSEKTSICYSSCTPLVSPLFTLFSTILTKEYFERKNREFVKKQAERLADANVIKIGITGSFGKTSCKRILTEMLSEKYKVISTESNFNTPMGIALTVEKTKGDEEVFIAEMGARKKGDIKCLCETFKPDIGIITGVCAQHMETFVSLHEIYTEKNELSKYTSVCAFNCNDKYALKMYKERKGLKLRSCIGKTGDAYADNVSISFWNTKFDLHINGKVYATETKLLGRHNLQNIVLCATIASYLGVDGDNISAVIKNLTPTPHRLEYLYANGIHILDDGYNSNEAGIRYATEVIDSFDGRKVAVSQGIAEGGKEKKRLNFSVGKRLSEHVDVMILCGSNRRLIKKGIDKKYAGETYVYSTLAAAQKHFDKILRKGDLLFLQNDLPDIL
ncbi:MAG: UDP-N-acetylmuramoyl-tripeptide--D-alanyl-D-alanine ligase [Clostridiales bacterium]|nr:UDP-N-acetylmuramoyl-tripeptide--D-alanyl-D-alanine ligase [Clostridiales bacterium]